MYQASYIEILFCFAVWLIAMFVYLPSLKTCTLPSPPVSTRSQFFLLFLLITFYSVFEFAGGDFYSYKEFYEQEYYFGMRHGLDPIYLWLIGVLPNNFYIWRFVVWGSATLIWLLLIKRLGYSVRLAGFLFFIVVFFLFVGARQSLGFSLLYLGMTLVIQSKRTLHKLIGLFVFLSAYFFHSTMIVYMLLTLFALLPFSKRGIILLILLFPLVHKLFDPLVDLSLDQISFLNERSTDRIQVYLDSDFRATSNIYGLIRLTIERLPIFILVFLAIRDIYWRKVNVDKIYRYLLMMTFILIYVSYLFIGRELSAFIAPRFWDASLFPLTLFLGHYLTCSRPSKLVYFSIFCLILSKFFTYFYALYKL